MKKIILFTFILSISAHAENSRSPAVLDGTCKLNIPLTVTTIVNGKEVVQERDPKEVMAEQCKAVKQCMYSADDEQMNDLKSLEAVACNNNMNAVTTKTPGPVVEKSFDGKRKAKFDQPEQLAPAPQTATPTAISK